MYQHGNSYAMNKNTSKFAALHGQSPAVLRWMRDHGCPWDRDACVKIARIKHLHVTQWSRKKCPWDSGNCAVIQWLRENGCPWDRGTCFYAAGNGHLHILQWLRENGCPWDSDTCASLARSGNLHIIQWSRENGCPWDSDTCASLASSRYLRERMPLRQSHLCLSC